MEGRRAAGALLALAACFAYAAAAPTINDQTALELYGGDAAEGCYYNFQHYGEGDRIMTNEPCLNCTCHNRMLMCYLRVCPFTKPIGHDCTIEKRADQCCPIITCPDVPVDLLTSTSTTSPAEYGATGVGHVDKYGCSINERYYAEGSKVPSTPNKPCEHCYCIRNMTTCVMQECTLHVDGCTPIYHKDVCCPVRYSCDHPEDEILRLDDMTTTVRPTPGFLLTTTVSSVTQDCVHDDQIFADGALIKTEKACEHCYCMKGDIVCVVQECGTPMENEGKNCTSLAPREGQCCPDTYICEGDHDVPSEQSTTLAPPSEDSVEGSGYTKDTEHVPLDEFEGSGLGDDKITEPSVDIIHDTTLDEQHPSRATTPTIIIDETEADEQFQSTTLDDKHKPHGSTFIPPSEDTTPTLEPDKGENTVPHGLPEDETVTTVEIKKEEITTIENVERQDLTTSKPKIEETVSEPISEQTSETIIDSSTSQDVYIETTEISTSKTDDQSDHEPESRRTTLSSKSETTTSPEVVTDTISSETPDLPLSTGTEDQTSESYIYPVTESGDNVEVSTEHDIHVDTTTIKELFITTEKEKEITDKSESATISAEEITTESHVKVSTKTTEEFPDKDVSQTTTENVHILKETQITDKSASPTISAEDITTESHMEVSTKTTEEFSDKDVSQTTTENIHILKETQITDKSESPTISAEDITTESHMEVSTKMTEEFSDKDVSQTTIENVHILKETTPVSHKEDTMFTTTEMSDIISTTVANFAENEIGEDEQIPPISSPGIIPGEGACLVDGVTYSNESIVPTSHKCQASCKCMSSIVKCDTIQCTPPPENMINCQPEYDSEESCCPTYTCDHSKETIPPQPHSQMSGTDLPPSETEDCGENCIKRTETTKPECTGNQCEVDEIQPVKVPELCSSGSCGIPKDEEKPSSSPDQGICTEDGCVSTPQCVGDNCEVLHPVAQPTDASKLPTDTEKDIPSGCEGDQCISRPIECTGVSCEIPEQPIPPTDKLCDEEHGCTPVSEQHIPSTSCTGDSCEPTDQQPQVPCGGDDECKGIDEPNIPTDSCEGDLCVPPQPVIPVTVPSTDCTTEDCTPSSNIKPDTVVRKDDTCSEEHGCKKPISGDIPVTQCSDETCVQEAIPDQQCDGKDCKLPDSTILEKDTPVIESSTSDVSDAKISTTSPLLTVSEDISSPSKDNIMTEPSKLEPETEPYTTEFFMPDIERSTEHATEKSETIGTDIEYSTKITEIGTEKSSDITDIPETEVDEHTKSPDTFVPESDKPTDRPDTDILRETTISSNVLDTSSLSVEESTETVTTISEIEKSTDTSDEKIEMSTEKIDTFMPETERSTEIADTRLSEIERSTEKDTSSITDISVSTETSNTSDMEKSTEIVETSVSGHEKATETVVTSSPEIEISTERDITSVPDVLELSTESVDVLVPEIEKSTEIDDNFVTDTDKSTKIPESTDSSTDRAHYSTTLGSSPDIQMVTEGQTPSDLEKPTDSSTISGLEKSSETPKTSTPEIKKSTEPPVIDDGAVTDKYGESEATPTPEIEKTTEIIQSSVFDIDKSTETQQPFIPDLEKSTEIPDTPVPVLEVTTETVESGVTKITKSTEKTDIIETEITLATESTPLPETAKVTDKPDFVGPESEKTTETSDVSKTEGEDQTKLPEILGFTEKPGSPAPDLELEKSTELPEDTVTETERIMEISDLTSPEPHKSTENTNISEFTESSVSEVEKSTDIPKITSQPQIDDTVIFDLGKTTVTSGIEKSTEIIDTSLPEIEKSTEIVFAETTTHKLHKTSQKPTDILDIATAIPYDVTIAQDHVSTIPEETSTESVSDGISTKDDTDKLITEQKPDTEYTRIPEEETTETSIQVTSELPVSVKQETSSVISMETKPFTETTQSDYKETQTPVPETDQEKVLLTTEPSEKIEPSTHYTVEITEDSRIEPETTTVYLVELEEHTHKSQEDITTTLIETYSSTEREEGAVSKEPHKEDVVTASHEATTEKERDFTSQPTEISSLSEVSEDITKSTDLKQDEFTTFEQPTTKSISEEQVIDESTDAKQTTLGIELEHTRRTTLTLTVLDSKKETIEDKDITVTPPTEISSTDLSAKDHDESSEKISTTVATLKDQKHVDETQAPQNIDEEQPESSTHPHVFRKPELSDHVTEGIVQPSPTDDSAYTTETSTFKDDTTVSKIEGAISSVSGLPVKSVHITESSIQESTTNVEKIATIPTEQEVSTITYESSSMSSEPSIESHYTTAGIPVDVEDQTKHADSTDVTVETTSGMVILEDKPTTPDLTYQTVRAETTVSSTPETSKVPVIDDNISTQQVPDFTETVENETTPSDTIESITQEAITSESISFGDISETTPLYSNEDTVLPEKRKPDTITEATATDKDETTEFKIEEPKLTTVSDTTVPHGEIDLYTTHKVDLTTNIQDDTSKKTEDKELEMTTLKITEDITLKPTDDKYASTTLIPETEVPAVKDDIVTEKIPVLVTEEQYPETTHKDDVEVKVTELTESPTKLAQPSASSTTVSESDLTELTGTTLADRTIDESDQTTTVKSAIDVTKEDVEPSDQSSKITTETAVTKQVAHASTEIPIAEQEKTEAKPTPSTVSTEEQKPATADKLPSSTPSDLPSPDEDSEHQVQEQFPPSGGGYSPEQDYGEDDQAFGPGTCRYGGKVYVSAQQIPRDDPCDFCFCFRSDIICLQQSCPPPIHGCHEEPIQGFCCPRYECPVSMATTLNVTTTTTTTTTTLPPHFLPHAYKGAAQRRGCQIKGHSYQVGEFVKASSGPCLHCTCGGDGQMKCDPKACTPEPMLRQMIAAAVSSKRRR